MNSSYFSFDLTLLDPAIVDYLGVYILLRCTAAMRDRLLSELGEVPRHRFLVYLMGPYKTFSLDEIVADTDVDSESLSVDFGSLTGDPDTDANAEQTVLDRLLHARDQLRIDPGVNAFLALDAGIDLEEMDAATQSIAFARASNAVAFIAPKVGKNLGVGIETGSVLEDIFREQEQGDETSPHRTERIVFVHEAGVRSAMIASISRRWEATIYSYETEEELVRRLREFVANVIRKELTGDLPPLDTEDDDIRH
jgi:hypothetical protein